MTPTNLAMKPSAPDVERLLDLNPDLRIEQDEYNINVTSNDGDRVKSEDLLAHLAAHDGAGLSTHLYIHIPLCSYICHFCNYVKQLMPKVGSDETLTRWTNLIISESERYLARAQWLGKAHITSFFIGGGTAALLSGRNLASLMEHLRGRYDFSRCIELTLEGNPDNFQGGRVLEATRIGFNRFSVGVQSLQTDVNAFAGREHDRDASLQAISKLLESGCPFNVDLMFGLPHQTVASVTEDVATLVKMRVPTITIYRFRNAERHKMGIGNRSVWNVESVRSRLHQQRLFPDLRTTYRMREAMVRVLLENDYCPSPCGWWSAPNTYPWGNIPHVSKNKWQNYDTMVAFGPGAYGWLTGRNDFVVQTHNESDINAYLKVMETTDCLPLAFGRVLKGWKAVASALAFAFKANQPISIARFLEQYGVHLLRDEPAASAVSDLIDRDMLHLDAVDETLLPTLEGEALHEEIMTVYIHGRIGGCKATVCKR